MVFLLDPLPLQTALRLAENKQFKSNYLHLSCIFLFGPILFLCFKSLQWCPDVPGAGKGGDPEAGRGRDQAAVVELAGPDLAARQRARKQMKSEFLSQILERSEGIFITSYPFHQIGLFQLVVKCFAK